MNTSVSTKFAALALALFANTVLMGSVAVLFNVHPTHSLPVAAVQTTYTGTVA